MTDAERQCKFAEIVKLINHETVDIKYVADAWEWKKQFYGEKHADKLLDDQIEFEDKKRGVRL